MIHNRYLGLALMLLMSVSAFAQKAERDYIRKGNRAFKDSVYVDAEVNYRKALDANPSSTIARFNLGNTLLWQNYEKAIEAYKESLRNNPSDDETRYNLALAQKMLKDQQQNQQNQNQDQQNQQQQQQQEQQQDQQQQDQQDQQQQQQPEQRQDEMSKENAEQLLNSVMQDEQNTQDKVKKQQVIQGSRLEKDW